VRALLEDDPELPVTVIAERVGWEGSITAFGLTGGRSADDGREGD
jgi:hypothetical protein